MNDPSKQSPPSTLDTVLIPVPLESSLQHSNFRQLTNCIQDVHEVRYVPRTSADDVIVMDARSAMRPCYILPMFFSSFFMAALVGQTAERIFTKLSHVVDIRRYLRTY